MGEFRKKPVIVEAVQWFCIGDHPKVYLREPLGDLANFTDPVPWIGTLEGGHIVTPGDWIVTGVVGEHYPCKPHIFEVTYEPVEDPTDV